MSLTTQWSAIEDLNGDAASDAWHWFIERYREFVTVVLQRLIWSPVRAAAASDEFWGYLFQSGVVENLQRRVCFRAYLTSTLRNYARDWMRRNARVPQQPLDECPPVAGALPEDEEVTLWARQLVHLALRRLARVQPRQARVLQSFYGLPETMDVAPAAPRSATDLAAEFGCKANALHQLMFRARRKLHECLVEEVQQTVSNRRDLACELEILLSAIGRVAPGVIAPPAAAEGVDGHDCR